MALFDWIGDSGPVITGRGVRLRPPRPGDHPEWAYLQPWEPAWPEDDLTRAAFRRRLSVYGREMDLGTAWPFLIFDALDGALLGGVTLSNIRRGVAQTGTVGYWIGRPYAGRGHGAAAVEAVCDFAFDRLGLHRLEAACLPDNHASRRVLEKTGFRHEGLARAYLRINGVWADHLLFGLLDRDWRAQTV
jgi:ribosomal-protein-alanine N-acetyltransferase